MKNEKKKKNKITPYNSILLFLLLISVLISPTIQDLFTPLNSPTLFPFSQAIFLPGVCKKGNKKYQNPFPCPTPHTFFNVFFFFFLSFHEEARGFLYSHMYWQLNHLKYLYSIVGRNLCVCIYISYIFLHALIK